MRHSFYLGWIPKQVVPRSMDFRLSSQRYEQHSSPYKPTKAQVDAHESDVY